MRSKRTKQSNGNGGFTRNRVFEIAAEVFHRKGYDNTSMSDIASAAGLTKAGLYHHIDSKESLLYTVLDYGLDLTEFYVVKPLQEIADPLERLKKMIDLHLHLVLEERNLEVTGLLHECKTLSAADRARVNRRKKEYVRMTAKLIADVAKEHNIKDVNPKLAAFALLGMLNWTYQWFKATGPIRCDEIIAGFQKIFLLGILGRAWEDLPDPSQAAAAR
ncbi:MAG: TetR/AcrR family transcriptional regulator [Acidobacteria bacterium]|nr:MAG: TetR/AcrR family transcriptional regulator [Acidobacteriota bacterium]